MANQATVGLTATMDISDFQRNAANYIRTLQQMQQAAQQAQTNTANSFSRMGNMGGDVLSTLDSIGKGFMGIGAAAAAAAAGGVAYLTAQSINMAASFEQGMADISAVMGRTTAEIQPLNDLIQQLAVSPDLKVSFDEAQQASMTLAKSGIHLEQQLGGALRAVIEGMNATGASADFVARAVGSTMDVFGLEAGKTSHVIDGMVGVLNNSRMSVTDYTYAVNNAGAVMRQFGVTSDQFNAILVETRGEFSSGRTQGAGFAAMLKGFTAPTDKAAELMQQLGISVSDSNGQFKNLFQLVEETQTALSKLSPAEAARAMQAIFGTEGRKAFSSLLGLTEERLNEITIATNASGQAAEAAATRMEALESKMGILRDIITGTQLAFGNLFTPILIPIMDKINAKATQLSTVFQEFGLSGVANVLGFSEQVVGAIDGIEKALGRFGATLASGGLGTTLSELGFNVDYLTTAFYALTGAAGALLVLGTVAATVFVAGAAFAALSSPIGMAIAGVAALGAAWNTNFLHIQDITMAVYGRVSTTLSQLATITTVYISRWVTLFKNGASAIYNGISAVFYALPTPVQDAMMQVYNLVTGTMNQAIGYINDSLASISSAAGGYLPSISLPSISNLAFPDMQGAGAGLGNALSGLFNIPQISEVPQYITYLDQIRNASTQAGQAAADSAIGYADANSGLIDMGSGAERAGKSVESMAKKVADAREKISDNNVSMANLRGEIAQLESQFPGLTNELISNFNAHIAAGNSVESFGDKLGATERRQMFNYLVKLNDMNQANQVAAGSNATLQQSLGATGDAFKEMYTSMQAGLSGDTGAGAASGLPVVAQLFPPEAVTQATGLATTMNDTVTPALQGTGIAAETLATGQMATLQNEISGQLNPALGQLFTTLSTQITPAFQAAATAADAFTAALQRVASAGSAVVNVSGNIYKSVLREIEVIKQLTSFYLALAQARREANAAAHTGMQPGDAGTAPATQMPQFASGGAFVVPSGYPTHRTGMPIGVHSGELVQIFTAEQTRQLRRTQVNSRLQTNSTRINNNNSKKTVNINVTTQQPSKSIANDLAFIKAKYGVF